MTRYIKQSDDNFTVLQDKQEKKPWSLTFPVEIEHLKVGDYTIKGYKDIIAIEKKSGIKELLNDLAFGYRPTFKRFLAKMRKHPICCIVVGEPLDYDLIVNHLREINRMSKGKCKLTPRTIYYWVGEIMTTYGVPILFVHKMELDKVLPEIFRAAYVKARQIK